MEASLTLLARKAVSYVPYIGTACDRVLRDLSTALMSTRLRAAARADHELLQCIMAYQRGRGMLQLAAGDPAAVAP